MAVADFDAEELLADLPSDAFSSPERDDHGSRNDSLFISSQPSPTQQTNSQQQRPQAVMRQTTLFGGRVPGSTMPANKPPARPVMNSQEPPTHHKLDQDALKTWIYPTNLGTIRDYQFNIVARGLSHNLLVALPTGLGKTFIAATVMLNWFRWTKDAQIIFVAPTKPLVAQQVKACFNIVGIPRHETTMLTGETPPDLRADEWETKRVFFTTPQTIMNDLSKGICDPKRIVLIVVDEAHRATGGYAYVQLVNFVRRFNPSFRVLGLTATPGDSVEKVQQVIDGLGISRVEIRTELSIDIRQFVHRRDVETVLFDPSEEMVMVLDLFAKALQPLLDKLCGQNAFYQRDAKLLTSFGLHQASVKWRASDAGRKASFPLKAMIHSIFTLLASLAHPITLLRFHGIGPFYHNLLGFQNEKSGGKYNKQIKESPHFQQMMTRIKPWIANPRFIGHPKLEYLEGVLLDHFSNAGSGPTGQNTRVMVFVHYRDSAEEATRVLQRHAPLIKPHVFVGQADSKSSEGMNQKTQLEIIEKFQKGEFNTIVATCIGEEGLDIGEVDLIVCYDASASPIRMLQRMGRTGRKRAGKIVLLMMRGKEENDFVKAKDNYEQMQKMISSGERFNFHYDLSPRIVPRAIQPAVEKRTIEIPIENSQSDLPEPKRRKGKKRAKKAPKKFHMPDGVRTGFVKASRLGQGRDSDDAGSDQGSEGETPPNLDREEAAIPDLAEVSLTSLQLRELEMNYQQIGGEDSTQVVELPHLDAFPSQQRNLAPTSTLRHGRATRRMVSLLQKMHSIDGERLDVLERNFDPEYLRSNSPSQKAPAQASKATKKKTRHPVYARNEKRQTGLKGRDVMSEEDLDDSDEDDLDGFIVDDASVTEREPSSEAASPAPLDGEGRPFYTSQKDYQGESEEDELPEFGEMVKKPGKVAPADSTKGRDVGRKAKRRRVIEDSSD